MLYPRSQLFVAFILVGFGTALLSNAWPSQVLPDVIKHFRKSPSTTITAHRSEAFASFSAMPEPPAAGVTQISLATTDIVFDPIRQLIYASVPSSGGAYANSVVSIDPSTGVIGAPLTSGANPGRLALSGDGHYLYVSIDGSSLIRRLDLQSQTTSLEFSLGIGSVGYPLYAEEIEVLPGQPESIAISLQSAAGHDGVVIYDNATPRTNRTPRSPQNDVIEFGADAATLYGENTTTTEFGVRKLPVNSNGLSVAGTLQNLSGNEADMKFDSGRIYQTSGAIIDPLAWALVGKFHLPGFGYGVAPDSANNRVYFITGATTDISPGVWAYDLNTMLPIGKVSLSALSGWPKRLIRCGPNGLALRTSTNQVFIVQLSAIQPISGTPLPSPTVGPDSVIKLQLPTNDLIFDPGTQKTYASVPGDVTGIGNSIIPIDPQTGNPSQPVFVGSDPTKFARSDNNQYLYVGLDGAGGVRQFNLGSQTPGLQFSLGFSSFSGPMYVNDIEVQPGNPSVVAVSRKNKGFFPNFEGVAIYDGGVQRPNTTPSHTGSNAIEFSTSPSVLYGLDTATTASGFQKLSIDNSGVSSVSTIQNVIFQAGDFEFDNGLVYATNGQVADPETATLLGAFPITGLVVPDSASGRVYFLSWSSLSPTVTIFGFDNQKFLPVNYLVIPNVNGTPGSFIRWGADGLAFRTTGNQVYFFHISSLHPYPSATPTFTTRSDGVRVLSLPVNDIVYNPSDHFIYASVPSAAGSIGNSITPIDPSTNSIGQSVFVGSEPYRLALADSGDTLYTSLAGVPRVRRFDLQTHTPGIQFGLGSEMIWGPFYGDELAVAPGNSNRVAVSTYLPPIAGGTGIVLADNGTLLPNKAGGESLAFSGAYLYTYNNYTSEFGLRKLALTGNGFSEVGLVTNVVNGYGSRIAAANGLIYGSDGAVADAGSLNLVGKFVRTDPGIWVVPDLANHRVYFLGLDLLGTSAMITAYDSQTFLQVGSFTVKNILSSDVALRRFIRYGTDGLAFTTSDDNIYFLTTSMVTPVTPTPVPTPIQITSETKQLSLTTGDLAYNPADGMIYASVPSRMDGLGSPITFGNSIVPINPLNATVGQPVPAGSEPKKLALSGNGQYLYAALDGEGAVGRLDVATKTFGGKFSLGNDAPFKGPRYVEDMQVAPGTTGTLAISRMHKNGTPRHLGVAIYDNGMERPVTTENTFPSYTDNNNVIEYGASSAVIYGYNLESSSGDFHKLAVSASGVQTVSGVQNLFFARDVKFDNGLLYSSGPLSNAPVVNPETASVVANFTDLGSCGHLVQPDSINGIVYFLVDNCNGTASIRAYNQSSYALLGSTTVPGVKGNIASFIKWGANGFAFRTTSSVSGQGNQLFITQWASAPLPPATMKLSAASYTVDEGAGFVAINVSRTGDTSAASSIKYATSDNAGSTACDAGGGNASERCDYSNTNGTLNFAPGENSKTLIVPIADDGWVEGNETFALTLSLPGGGAGLGSPSVATVTILDNDANMGPPAIMMEESSNRAIALDSVTFTRGPFRVVNPNNFSVDQRTRLMILTSNLRMTQADPGNLSVQASGVTLPIERVGPITNVPGLDASYIVVRLPDGLPDGDLQLVVTLRGMASNLSTLQIVP